MQRVAQACGAVELEALRAQAAADPGAAWVLPQALALWRLERPAELLVLLEEAPIDLHQDPQYWLLRGMASRRIGDSAVALAAYRQALALAPERCDLHYNLANLQHSSNPAAAQHHYIRSLSLDPWQGPCWHNLGLLLHQQDCPQQTLAALRTSLLLNPTYPDAWCNLGLAYMALEAHAQAERCFAQAIALDPSQSASHTNMGTLLVARLQPDQALAYLERGVELDRNSAHALFNLGLCQLLLGRFDTGWAYYEARLRTHLVPPECVPTAGPRLTDLAQAPKLGEPPLVVWAEQGLGDAIQFCRYLALLDAVGVAYVFQAPRPLVHLMRLWLKPAGAVEELPSRTNAADTRRHCPLLSLPRLFGTEAATIPGVVPYFKPPEAAPARLRVPEPPGGLAVGLVWAANPGNTAMYRHKSIPLALLMPRLLDLVELDLVDLHLLQVGPDNAQLDPWRQHPRITDWAPQLGDFADTAHVVQQLDLVIAVDTAVAHLAAALNRPTWVLLPCNADFRWQRERWDSPWYPGCLRLFRQPSQGDWHGVVEAVHQALDRLFLLDLEALAAAKLVR